MKIIGVDNYNRESIADYLVCDNVRDEAFGNAMVKALNEYPNGSTFFRLVPSDHRLSLGMEDLV